MDPSRADRMAALCVSAARAAWRALPARARKGVEDRVFWAVFQRTRVENDAYGWRPPPPGGSRTTPDEP